MRSVILKFGAVLFAITMILLGSAMVLGQARNSAVLALSRVWNSYAQIVLLDVNTGLAVPITQGHYAHHVPVWSSDGRQIAYIRDFSPDFAVGFVELDGSNDRTAYHLSFTNVAELRWSPDNTRVAFDAALSDGYDLVMVNVATLTWRRLTFTHESEQNMVWSSNGRSIAYTIFVNNDPSDSELFVVDVHSLEIRNVSNNDKQWDGFPIWSPDSTQIAYQSERELGVEIYVIDLVDDTQRNLSQSPTMDIFPMWLPDGSGVVFGAGEDVSQGELRWVDIETGESHLIAEDVSLFTQPALSPDGTRLLYVDTDDVIHIVTRSGEPIITTNSTGPMNNIQWSPDGRYVAFVSGARPGVADGLLVLYIIDVNTGQIHNLGQTSDVIYSWRP